MRLEVQVTAKSGLNVRSGPGTNYRVVRTLTNGTITTTKGDRTEGGVKWYTLLDGTGYVCAAYVKVLRNLDGAVPTQPTNTTTPPTNSSTGKPSKEISDIEKLQKLTEREDVSAFNTVFGSNLADKSIGVNEHDAIDHIQNNAGFPPEVGTDSSGVKIYNYFMDHSFIEQNLKKIENNVNLINQGFKSINYNLFHKFNRFKIAFPDYHLGKTFSHVIFTRPDLNLVDYQGQGNYKLLAQVENDPLYYYLFKSNPSLVLSLTKDFDSSHDFQLFLSNTANSFEVSDEFIKTVEHGETFTGHKVQYGKHNIESQTAGTFSISYTDDQELTIYKLHKAWIEYISKVYRGELLSKKEYIREKILDYACSAYYFLCGPDGETIIFWSKYYGVFPTNTPSSTTSWSKGNQVKFPDYNINYAYSFKEDFSPLTLAEFNMNSKGSYVYRKIYEPELVSTGKTLTGVPFIETKVDNAGGYVFKLKYRT